MNNEEKKAIEYFKEKIGEFLIIKQRLEDNGKEIEKCDIEKINNYKTVLNLIEKQAKEIEDKKEEIYSIAKTNYILGQTDERSQWYKKINEKIEELKRENDKLEEKKTFRITDKELIAEVENNEAVTDLLNYKIRLAIIGILEELIGKEE